MCAWSHLFTELFLLPWWCSQIYLGMTLTPLRVTSVSHNSKPLVPNCVLQEDSPSIREMSCGEHPESRDPRGQSQEIFPLRTPQPVGGSFATSWFLKLAFGGNGQKSIWFKRTSIVDGVLTEVGRTSTKGNLATYIKIIFVHYHRFKNSTATDVLTLV